MYDISYTVSQSQIMRSTPWYPVGGSVGIYRAVFAFSPEWDGLVKTAVFRSAAAEREQLLDDANSCIVPWEPLQLETGWLEVGVYGVDGTTKHPTYWDASVPVGPGPGKSDPAQEPSPDKWQQYVDEIKDAVPAAVEEYLDEHPHSGGLSMTEKNNLLTILSGVVLLAGYQAAAQSALAALRQAWAPGEITITQDGVVLDIAGVAAIVDIKQADTVLVCT